MQIKLTNFKFCLIIIFLSGCSGFNKNLWRKVAEVKPISVHDLKSETLSRLDKVEEFKMMKIIARELGIERVYFFGGSASAWIHYVYWDLEREAGKGNYHNQRFDYDYSSIFRSNQDMDVVVDIDPRDVDKVVEFERRLSEKFPHFQGNKSAWEVRPLRFKYGSKDSLLDNSDFLNQNTDSHSTGLIEVTGNDDFGIRDIRDWENIHNNFLKDAHAKKNTYYYDQQLHRTTKRFKKGLNPEIMSAIRYLIKAVQYELSIDIDAEKNLRKVLLEFNAAKDLQEKYSETWLENNGKKLYQNAVSLEYAYHLLREYGVQDFLIKASGDIDDENSLAWWMNKKPLLTLPFGDSTQRKTAKELGIEIVAHETSSFFAYESITKSYSGEANVFVSRKNIEGESAAYGEGFYTAIGREGMRGTGMTIRFKMDPRAIEGIDFIKVNEVVIIKNKRAIEVINESLNLSLAEYFEKLSNKEILFDASDRAIKEKVKRKLLRAVVSLDSKEEERIYKILLNHVREFKGSKFDETLIEWFDLEISRKYPELVEQLIEKGKVDKEVAKYILSKRKWENHPELVEKLIEKGKVDREIAKYILSKEQWKNHSEWIEKLVERGNVDEEIAEFVLSKPHFKNDPIIGSMIYTMIKRKKAIKEIIKFVLSKKHLDKHPELHSFIKELFSFKDEKIVKELSTHILTKSHLKDIPGFFELIDEMINEKDLVYDKIIARNLLSKDYIREEINLNQVISTLLTRGYANDELAKYVFTKPDVQRLNNFTYFLDRLIKDKKFPNEEVIKLFGKPQLKKLEQLPDFIERIINKPGYGQYMVMQHILSKKHLKDLEALPSLIEKIILRNSSLWAFEVHISNQKHIAEHPYFLEKLQGKPFTVDNIRNYLETEESKMSCSVLLQKSI